MLDDFSFARVSSEQLTWLDTVYSSHCLVDDIVNWFDGVSRDLSRLAPNCSLRFVVKRMRRAESPNEIEKVRRSGLVFVSCRLGISGRHSSAHAFT